MPKKSSISIFIAATSALAISTVNTNSVKSGENDLGGLKEWNTDMALDAGARGLLAKHGRSDDLDLIFKSYSNLLRVLGD